MDAPRFDAITKAWVSVPRRRVLTALAAGALGPLLGLGGREAGATLLLCKRTRTCPKGKRCLHKVCVQKCADPFTCGSASGTGCTDAACFCSKKPGGGSFCAEKAQCDATLRACTSQRDCRFLEVCVRSGCCGADDPKFTCQAPCDA